MSTRRRNTLIAITILILIAILLLLINCPAKQPAPKTTTTPDSSLPTPNSSLPTPTPDTAPAPEKLTPATITAPASIPAGSSFTLTWTGPDNPRDYITIVPASAPATASASYAETKTGATLELTAPTTPGPHELRYLSGGSHTILGRAAIEVTPVTAAIDAPADVRLGSTFTVTWTGPNNRGDYITIVPVGALNTVYGSYADTDKGPPATLTAPTNTGPHELRYIAGPEKRILAMRPITITAATVTLSAPDTAVAGSTIQVTWTGPNNRGDYITIVERGNPDDKYGNYTDCSRGSPLPLLTPILDGKGGDCEIRYCTSDRKVLARRPITISAPKVTLSAPDKSSFDTDIRITWTGPDNPGDYITIVPKSTPDGQYGPYQPTSRGSPLTIKVPKAVGGVGGGNMLGGEEYEVRYMTGQGHKVLGRVGIRLTL